MNGIGPSLSIPSPPPSLNIPPLPPPSPNCIVSLAGLPGDQRDQYALQIAGLVQQNVGLGLREWDGGLGVRGGEAGKG